MAALYGGACQQRTLWKSRYIDQICIKSKHLLGEEKINCGEKIYIFINILILMVLVAFWKEVWIFALVQNIFIESIKIIFWEII